MVGESENTARYIGINVRKVILRTMIRQERCADWSASCLSADPTTPSRQTRSAETALRQLWSHGWRNSIPCSCFSHPSSFASLRTGSGQVTSDFSIDSSYGDIPIGIVLFFIIGCEFFINYRVCFRKKQKEA